VLRRTISQLAMMLMLKIAGADAKGEASEFYKNKFDDTYVSSHDTSSPLIPAEPFTYGSLAICGMQ
jgi:hypothetical protein